MNKSHLHWNVIINPNAYKGKCLNFWSKLRKLLWEKGYTFNVWDSPSTQKCEEIVRQLLEKQAYNIMVVGGDGTLNEVINALIRNNAELSKVFLSVVPSGTGNDWAKTHAIPNAPEKLAAMFCKGTFVKHDIGKVVIENEAGISERHFINIAGLGFDAEVILRVINSKEYRYGSRFIYLKNLFLALKNHNTIPCTIIANDKTSEVPLFTMAAGICKYNGNGMKQVPMAVFNDGLLDVVYIEAMSFWEILTQLPRLFNGSHIKHKKVHHIRTSHLKVYPQKQMFAETEGEIAGSGCFNIYCLNDKINVLVS